MNVDIKLLAELQGASTPAPWHGHQGEIRCAEILDSTVHDQDEDDLLGRFFGTNNANNAQLVINTVNALPGLLVELDELQAKVNTARSAAGAMADSVEEVISRLGDTSETKLLRKAIQRWEEDVQATGVRVLHGALDAGVHLDPQK